MTESKTGIAQAQPSTPPGAGLSLLDFLALALRYFQPHAWHGALILLALFPELVTWLPERIYGS